MPEPILILVIVGMIALVLILFLTQEKKLNDQKESLLDVMRRYGDITKDHHKILFSFHGQTLEIKFFKLLPNQELTINSRVMWEVHGSGKPRLYDQSAFLTSAYKKIIVIYPSTHPIKRYINENELEFVSYHRSFFDMYVVKAQELESFLSEFDV